MPRAWRLAAVFLAGACQGPAAGTVRAIGDGRDAAPADASSALTWVDIAVVGCPSYDPAGPQCQGSGPLELRFTAITPAPAQSYLWSFGDGTPPVSSAAPVHRFLRPDAYTVTVSAGGPAGTVQARRELLVKVTAAGDGEDCAAGSGCREGLSCICPGGCPGLTGPGFCAHRCDEVNRCPTGQVCVDPGPRGSEDGWPLSACVRGCTADGECGPGQRCRELPAAAPAGSWARGCFRLGPLGDEGAPCRDAAGGLDDGRCLARDCAPLGARALCAAACDGAHPCPSYATCAAFTTGERRCLARCSADRPCDDDPFLGCEVSDTRGSLGFVAGDRAARLCAPRRCSADADCGPDGACVELGSARFCLLKTI